MSILRNLEKIRFSTTDVEILKLFLATVNHISITKEVYDYLLDRYGLIDIDLYKEQSKINHKTSSLSKSQRNAVPYFIALYEQLEQLNSQSKPSENSEVFDTALV